jgi:hypothetical protein
MCLILFWAFGVDDLLVGEGQESASLAETDNHIGLSYKVVEPFHQVLGDEVRPTLLVVWVLHHWSDDLVADSVHMFEDVLGDLHEDDVVFEVVLIKFVSADTQDDVAFAFVFVEDGGLDRQGDLICSCAEGIDDFVEVVRPQKAIERLSE